MKKKNAASSVWMSSAVESTMYKHKKVKSWQCLTGVLAVIVLLCATYTMILPAITMEQQTYCGHEEHVHTDACYEQSLICVPEEQHTHIEECYADAEVCVCGMEETTGHTHDEACYLVQEELVCTVTVGDASHTHTDNCYDKVLVCDKEEHTHNLMCYSDKDADVESPEVWEQSVSDVTLSGVLADDLIAIAESQLGYKESEKNFTVHADGDIKGYSRYGAWNGDSYGEWNTSFVLFCLSFAGIATDQTFYEPGYAEWTEALSQQGMYEPADSAEPQKGDLIFYSSENGDETYEQVGLVKEVRADSDGVANEVCVIAGDIDDSVKYVWLSLEADCISGYSRLPENTAVSAELGVIADGEPDGTADSGSVTIEDPDIAETTQGESNESSETSAASESEGTSETDELIDAGKSSQALNHADPSAFSATSAANGSEPAEGNVLAGSDLASLTPEELEELLEQTTPEELMAYLESLSDEEYDELMDSLSEEALETLTTYLAGGELLPSAAPLVDQPIYYEIRTEGAEQVLHLSNTPFDASNPQVYTASSPNYADRGTINRVVLDNTIVAPNNSSLLFSYFSNATAIDNLSNLDTSGVVNARSMFMECSKLTSLDLSSFNTSNITDMNFMFGNCKKLANLDLSNFVTDSVTSMPSLFSGCSELSSVDLSSFNTANVTTMASMFSMCSKLKNVIGIESFNTENVSSMSDMFNGCTSMESLDLSGFNTANVTTMRGMFVKCNALTALDLSSFNTAKVTDMSNMFSLCSALNELDLSSFNTAKVTNMSGLFNKCSSLTELDLHNFNTEKVTNMSRMFNECTSLSSLDISGFTVAAGTNVSNMLTKDKRLSNIKTPDSVDANVSIALPISMAKSTDQSNLVTVMPNLPDTTGSVNLITPIFYEIRTEGTEQVLHLSNTPYAGGGVYISTLYESGGTFSVFEKPNFSKIVLDNQIVAPQDSSGLFTAYKNVTEIVNLDYLDTSQTTNMRGMFSGCESLSAIDVSGFDTGNVTDMSMMFNDCKALESIEGIDNMDVKKVTTMAEMFSVCESLQTIDLSGFQTDSLTDTYSMFANCVNLSQIQFGAGFDTSKVTTMASMFWGCQALPTVDVSNFDTGAVESMNHMFSGCESLHTLNVSHFNTSSVTDMSFMFGGVGGSLGSGCNSLQSLDLTNWDTSSVTNMSYMFSDCNSLTELDLSSFDTGNVTNMSLMFYYCDKLAKVDVSSFDTSNVTNMDRMFGTWNRPTVLRELDLSSFDTANVTNMNMMFYGRSELRSLDISGFVITEGTNVDGFLVKNNNLMELKTPASVYDGLTIPLPKIMVNEDDHSQIFGRMPKLPDVTGSLTLISYETSLLTEGSESTLIFKKYLDGNLVNDPERSFEFGVFKDDGTDTGIRVNNNLIGNILVETENLPLGRYYIQEIPGTEQIFYDSVRYYFTIEEETISTEIVYPSTEVVYLPIDENYLDTSQYDLVANGFTVTAYEKGTQNPVKTLRAYCADKYKGITHGSVGTTPNSVYVNPTENEINLARGYDYIGPNQGELADAIKCVLFFGNKYEMQDELWGLLNYGVDVDTSRVGEIPANFNWAIIQAPNVKMQPLIVPFWTTEDRDVYDHVEGDSITRRTVKLETTDIDFKNVTRVGNSLTIEKEVTGIAGDINRLFNFSIDLWDREYYELNGTFNVVPGATIGVEAPNIRRITFSNGHADVQLKHGQNITITGLPDGYVYTVTEDEWNMDGYTSSLTQDSNSNYDPVGDGYYNTDDTGAVDVEFENWKEEVLEAEITAKKTLDGGLPAAGQFTFILKDADGNEVSRMTNDGNGDVTFPLTFTKAGEYVYTIIEESNDGNGAIVYDTSVKTVKVIVGDGENKLQVINGGSTFYGSRVANQFYITIGETELNAYNLYLQNNVYDDGTYNRKIVNPALNDIQYDISFNYYGDDLVDNLRKLMYYLDTHNSEDKIGRNYLTRQFKQELIWCLIGVDGYRTQSLIDAINTIIAQSTPPDDYSLVLFKSNWIRTRPLVVGCLPTSVTFQDEDDTFVNISRQYELPETGSIGTTVYAIGGLLLMCGALFLMYKSKLARKKEGYF